MKTTGGKTMQRMLKRIRIWLGWEEPRWWDEEPLNLIQGTALARALQHHRRACA
jgi:hypothetical protein